MNRMVRFRSEGRFDAAPAAVWTLAEAHADEMEVRRIHPWIRHQRLLEEGDDLTVVEQEVLLPLEMTCEVEIAHYPPKRRTMTWLSGPMEGSKVIHRYRDDGDGGTEVEVTGDLRVPDGMTGDEIVDLVKGWLEIAHVEDRRALRAAETDGRLDGDKLRLRSPTRTL